MRFTWLVEFYSSCCITEVIKEWFVGYTKWTDLLVLSGLGTSTAKEAKEYFSDMARHRIPFKYSNTEDDTAIELVICVKFALIYRWPCSIWLTGYCYVQTSAVVF